MVTRSSFARHQDQLSQTLSTHPVIPVVSVDDSAQAVTLVRALFEGGISIVEVTLRTPAALEALAAIRKAVPAVAAGAGTVLWPEQLQAAAAVGCGFAVSPGSTTTLLEASLTLDLPLLCGAATPTESQTLFERGIYQQKFFPAVSAGGPDYLAAIHGPLPELRFCPTGGITFENMTAYLSCPNVLSVGGSFMAPSNLVRAGEWEKITELAAAALRRAEASTA